MKLQSKELNHRLMQLCDKAYNHYYYLIKEAHADPYTALKEAERINKKEYMK